MAMAENHRLIRADAARIFDVLSDTDTYADWVVGAHQIRDADRNWPAVGSRLHHRVGVGPIKLNDNTEVVECKPGEKLVLHARVRPFGTAVVTMLLEPRAGATEVTMTENAGDRLSRITINPLTDWIVHLRNVESLRRLARIAESGVLKP
jgi:uncharacterized protein YndB with AHSA1/START domain